MKLPTAPQCFDAGVDFFADDPEEQQQAQAICARCPDQTSCLQDALMSRQMDGVWGGIDPDTLRKTIRRMRRSCPDCGRYAATRIRSGMHTCNHCGSVYSHEESYRRHVTRFIATMTTTTPVRRAS